MSGEVPSGWREASLKSTAEAGRNGFDDGDWIEAPYIATSGIRLIQTGNIGVGDFLDKPDSAKFISERSFKGLGCKWVNPGDILVCRLADPIGRACLVPEHVGRSVTAVDCTIYRPDKAVASCSFMLHKLNSRTQLALAGDVAGGSTRQRISRGNLGRIELVLPPLPEQRRIAEILDTLDEAIRKTEQVIAKLQQMKQGLLHDLLTRGIDENGELRDPLRHPEQFKDSPLGRIPKEWEVEAVGSLLNLGVLLDVQDGNHGGDHPKREDFVRDGIPFVMANNMHDGSIVTETCYRISRRQFESLRVGFARPRDVLLSHKGTIGETAVVPCSLRELMLTPQVTYYRCLPELLDPQYLELVFLSARFLGQMEALAAQSTRAFLSITGQRQLRIPLAPVREQRRLVDRFSQIRSSKATEEAQLAKLRLLKQGLMDDLLTGRIRVKVTEAAE